MQFNQEAYSNQWSLVTMETLKESIKFSLKTLTVASSTSNSIGPTQNSFLMPRFKPYNSSWKQPFSEGRSSKTRGTTCLICARPGHRTGECTKTTLENGKPVTSTFSNNSISAGTWAVPDVAQVNIPAKTFTLAPSVNPPNTILSPKNVSNPLSYIITPYNANSWDSFLAAADLTLKYPNLALKIHYGFPIGDPDPPRKTTILPNPTLHPDDPEHEVI
jgi:hypothetical protein